MDSVNASKLLSLVPVDNNDDYYDYDHDDNDNENIATTAITMTWIISMTMIMTKTITMTMWNVSCATFKIKCYGVKLRSEHTLL